MNWLQRFAVRLAARIAPPLRSVLLRAGGTVERLQESNELLRDMLDLRRAEVQSEMREWREALAMASGGWQPLTSRETSSISWRAESLAIKESGAPPAVVRCVERLAELELALEDRGWKRQLAIGDMEFSRYGLQQIMLLCRLMRIKNPIIQRGILVSAYYVFGRGVKVSCDDPEANEEIQAFFNNPKNQMEIGHSALCMKEAAKYTDGNLFWAYHADPNTGELLIRTIDPIEIEEIICNPNDHAEPWYYHRRWMAHEFDTASGVTKPMPMEAWYVDLRYEGPKVSTIGNVKVAVAEKGGGYIRVQHDKDGGLEKWHFGCPRAYAALDWARATKQGLEDYASIRKALARFAWGIETQGGAPAIAAFKQTLATTLGNNDATVETNPPPVSASTWITGPGNKLTAMNTSGKQDNPEGFRRLFHMAYMVFGLPETFFADVSVGTLATATSLDRPTQLKFMRDQEAWAQTFKTMGAEVLKRSASAPNGRLREAWKNRKITIRQAPPRMLTGEPVFREAKLKPKDPDVITVDVKFPAILEGDIPARVGAIVEAMTLNGFEATGMDERTGMGMLYTELGAEDPDQILEEQYPEKDYKSVVNRVPLMKFQNEQALNPPDPMQQQGGEGLTGAQPHPPMPRRPRPRRIDAGTNPQESSMWRALHELRGALHTLREGRNGHV